MTIGEMRRIINSLDDEGISLEQKGHAIHRMLDMETHNGITKDTMLHIIAFLWDLSFEWQLPIKEEE